MTRHASPARLLTLVVALCAPTALAEDILKLPIGDPARKDRDVALVLDAITDSATGDLLTPADLPRRIADVRLLLVGEEHTGMGSHFVEKRVIEELHRAGRKVSIGLEMYPYTQQRDLDEWTSGTRSEEEFIQSSRWYKSWGYPWAYYRDLFLFARDNRLKMFAINAPREVVSAVRKRGIQGLTPEEAAHIPTRIDTKNAEHLRLFKASFEDESFHIAGSDEQWQAMLDAQCTWDATMGHNAVRSLADDADPRTVMVLLVGAGHVQYGLGIERQVKQWFSGRVASVIPVAVEDEKRGAVKAVRASFANFLWGVPRETDPLYPDLGVATRSAEGESLLQVIDVEKKSPAERAGFRVQDVILTMDGQPVTNRESLARAMAGKRWGDAASFTVRREKEIVPLEVLFRRTMPAEAPTKR